MKVFVNLEKKLEGYVERHTASDDFYSGSVPLLMMYAMLTYHNNKYSINPLLEKIEQEGKE